MGEERASLGLGKESRDALPRRGRLELSLGWQQPGSLGPDFHPDICSVEAAGQTGVPTVLSTPG